MLFFITKVYFFYVDYGILYEELLVRAKKHKSCCIILCMIDVRVHTYIYVYISLSLMTTVSNNMAALAVLS